MNANAPITSTTHWLLDFILPPRCPGCRVRVGQQGALCATCWGNLVPLGDPSCALCDFPFDVDLGLATDASGVPQGSLCASCAASPPGLDRILTALAYDEASKDLILKFKHGRRHALAEPLGQLMSARLIASRFLATVDQGKGPLLIAPIPLHKSRLRSRRFNQSLSLARAVQARIKASYPAINSLVVADLLRRHQNTKSQAGLSRKGRFRNLAGAFDVTDKYADHLPGAAVLLVDDVFTTGATLESASKVLKRLQPSQIIGLCAARAPGPR